MVLAQACLANELRPDGITVNAICPDWVRTPMLEPSIEATDVDASDLSALTETRCRAHRSNAETARRLEPAGG